MTATVSERPAHPLETPGPGRRWWVAGRAVRASMWAALIVEYHSFVLVVVDGRQSGWIIIGAFLAIPAILLLSSRLFRRSTWYVPLRDLGHRDVRPTWRWGLTVLDATLYACSIVALCAWSPTPDHATVVAVIVLAASTMTVCDTGADLARIFGDLRDANTTPVRVEVLYEIPRLLAIGAVILLFRQDVYHGPIRIVILTSIVVWIMIASVRTMFRSGDVVSAVSAPVRQVSASEPVVDTAAYRLEQVRAIRQEQRAASSRKHQAP